MVSRESDRLHAENEQLRGVLGEAKEVILAQNARLQELTSGPLVISTIYSSTPDAGVCVVAQGGSLIEVKYPPALADVVSQIGRPVKVLRDTSQIVGEASVLPGGEIAHVKRIIDEKTAEIDYKGNIRTVVYDNGNITKLKKGDRVQLDGSGGVITWNLGKDDDSFKFSGITGVTWDHIGGCEGAKMSMKEQLEDPYKYPEIFKHYNKNPVKGILLWGPPGCGKTLLAKAAVTSLAEIHGAEAVATALIYVKGPEILNKYVGNSEENIRALFARAREHHAEHGYPAIIFIDEAESIMSKRGTGVSSDIDKTIVPMFLSEMDGLEHSSAIIILATNRPDMLDPAVTRDGRIDVKVEIPRPGPQETKSIFEIHMGKKPLAEGVKLKDLVKIVCSYIFNPEKKLKEISLNDNSKHYLKLGHVVNGAMVAAVVDKATANAIRRDKVAGGVPTGIKEEDVVEALDSILLENSSLDHNDVLKTLLGENVSKVTSIQKVIA